MKPWWRRQTLNPHYWVFLLQKDPRLMGLLIRDRHQEPGRMWGGDLSTSTDSRSHTSRPSLSSSLSWWTSRPSLSSSLSWWTSRLSLSSSLSWWTFGPSLSSSSWWTWDYQSSWWYSYSRSSIWWLVAIRVASWAQPSLVLPGGTNNLQDQAGETVMLVNHNLHYLLFLKLGEQKQ